MRHLSSRIQPRFWAALWLALAGVFSLAVVGLLLARPVQAAEVARPAQQINGGDRFEANDGPGAARPLGTYNPNVACNADNSAGVNIFTDATFSSTVYSPPTLDQDWYTLTFLNGQYFYTMTLFPSAGGPLRFQFTLQDAAGNNINSATSSQDGAPVTLGVYALNPNSTYRLFVSLANGQNYPAGQSTQYTLKYCNSATTVLPTGTPSSIAAADGYEPNDTPNIVMNGIPTGRQPYSFINVGSTIANVNFYPSTSSVGNGIRAEGDVDWYFFYSRQGIRLRITTAVQPGVDTELFLVNAYDLPNQAMSTREINTSPQGQIAYNDDYQPLDRGSQIVFDTPYEGTYWVKIWNKDPTPRGAGQGYNLTVIEINTLTPTLPPIPPTPFPAGADRFEYNGDFERASLVAPGVKADQLNFVPFQPPSPNTVDNDFYRLPVKQGIPYTCETLDLSAGTDTNMIVYNESREGIGGNDDISQEERARGNFRSRFSWVANYTGDYYLLIGEVNPPRSNEGQGRSYSLLCSIGFPPTATPTVNPNPPTPTVPFVPPTPLPTATPFPTPRPPQPLVVLPVDLSQARPTAQPSPTPRVMVIEVQTFNDFNRNGQLDPGTNEGIAGTPVQIYDANTGTPLGQAFTDGDGRVRFSIINDGPVQVRVPTFGFTTVVDQPNATVRIALQPAVDVPDRIP